VHTLLLVLLQGEISKVPFPHRMHLEHRISETLVHGREIYCSARQKNEHCWQILFDVILYDATWYVELVIQDVTGAQIVSAVRLHDLYKYVFPN